MTCDETRADIARPATYQAPVPYAGPAPYALRTCYLAAARATGSRQNAPPMRAMIRNYAIAIELRRDTLRQYSSPTRVVVHLDDQAVGAGGDRGARHRRHLVPAAHAVAGIDEDRQM